MTNLIGHGIKLQWMYNGIKIDGKLFKGWWSFFKSIRTGQDYITFYSRSYEKLPDIGMTVENNTDSMTDYFENDLIRFTPEFKLYAEALGAFNLQQARCVRLKASKELREAIKSKAP